MKFIGIFCFSLIALAYGDGDFWDLSNLGERISKSVQKSLEPLNNLGERIEHQVESNLAHLNGLGERINNEVQQSLLPVNAMLIKLSMKNGIGGKTIKKFPDGTVLLVENNVSYKCSGNLDNQGNCQGTLEPLNFNDTKNFCYVSPNARINNYACFTSGNSGLSVQDINGQISCKSFDNSPVLLIKDEDYRKLCGENGGQPIYTYIADVNNPSSVKIPSDNPYVKCENNTPNVCVFS